MIFGNLFKDKKEPNARVKRLANLLERYDNVMSGKRTSVEVKTEGKVGGKTKVGGKLKAGTAKIEIQIPDDSIESCVIGKGQNLQELGHMLYTRKPKALRHYWRHMAAYNFLEDQRVENVLSNKYPGMKKYFTYLTEKSGLRAKQDPAVLWGRRFYLPYEVPEPEAEIKDVIDAYMTSKNVAEREELARRFSEIYHNLQEPPPEAPAPQNTSSTRKNSDAEKQSSDAAKNRINKEKEKKEQKEKPGKGKGEEQKEQQGQGEQQQENGEGEQEEQGETGLGQGEMDSLQEALSSAMDEMSKEMGAPDSAPSTGQGMFSMGEQPMEKVRNQLDPKLIEEIYQIFRRVNVELSNTWNRNQKRGRIDIRAAMTSSNNNNPRIFKKYQQSKLQDNKISLVMMYDVSGSMDNNDPKGIEKIAIASMAVAASKASSEVCCIEFTSEARTVKDFRDTELKLMSRYRGGTNPHTALERFRKVKDSARHPVVLILFSDGDFTEKLGELASGIKLYKILVGSYARRYKDGSRYQNWLKMPDTEKLPELLKGIMTEVENEVKMKLLMQR